MNPITKRFLEELFSANDCEDCGSEEKEALDKAILGALEIDPNWNPTDDEILIMTDGEEGEMFELTLEQPNGEAIGEALTACFGSLE